MFKTTENEKKKTGISRQSAVTSSQSTAKCSSRESGVGSQTAKGNFLKAEYKCFWLLAADW
jgi:hypothetical protein